MSGESLVLQTLGRKLGMSTAQVRANMLVDTEAATIALVNAGAISGQWAEALRQWDNSEKVRS